MIRFTSRGAPVDWHAADGPIWVVFDYHVDPINQWRVTEYGRVIAHVPGHGSQILTPGYNVFATEAEALRMCMVLIDDMRRFFDDRAETAVRRLARVETITIDDYYRGQEER